MATPLVSRSRFLLALSSAIFATRIPTGVVGRSESNWGGEEHPVASKQRLEARFGPLYSVLSELLYPELLKWDPPSCIPRLDALKAWILAHQNSAASSPPPESMGDDDRFEMEAFGLHENTYRSLELSTFPPAQELFKFEENPPKSTEEQVENWMKRTITRLAEVHRKNIAIIECAFRKAAKNTAPNQVSVIRGEPYLGTTPPPHSAILVSCSFLRALIKMTSRVYTESNVFVGGERNYLNEGYYFFVWKRRFINVDNRKLEKLAERDEWVNDFLNRRMMNEIIFGRALRFVLLHEIGHVVFGHHDTSRLDCSSFKDNELEADRYAALMSKLIIGKADDADDPLFLLRLDRTGFTSFFAVAFRLAGFKDNPNHGCQYPSLKDRVAVAEEGWKYAGRIVGEA